MKHLSFTLFLLGSILLISCEKQELPNFIIIEADDAGYADFGFMGSDEILSPNLDQLAADGVVFTDAHVSGSVCSPSRAGMLTGRYQQRFGHEQNLGSGVGLDTTEITIADLLKTKGYHTALVGKWHLGREKQYHPNSRGFDYFYGMLDGHHSYFYNERSKIEENGKLVKFDKYLTDVFGDKVIERIDEYKDDPFFIHLSFNAVHTPLHATDEDLERFNHLKDQPARHKIAAMTWAMDRAIGNVLKKLGEEDLMDNTMIFFLSDNGGVYNISSNLPLKAFKGTEFDGGHRVPFIMKWGEKTQQGMTFEGLSSGLDIFPTIMHAAGIEETTGKALDGIDLLPYASGEMDGDPHESLFWRIHPWAAARVGDYKLVRASSIDTVLYNIAEDIGESTDLKDREPEIYIKMQEALIGWENEMMSEAWPGSRGWREVKYYMYNDLIANKQPMFSSPGPLNKWKKDNPDLIKDWEIEY